MYQLLVFGNYPEVESGIARMLVARFHKEDSFAHDTARIDRYLPIRYYGRCSELNFYLVPKKLQIKNIIDSVNESLSSPIYYDLYDNECVGALRHIQRKLLSITKADITYKVSKSHCGLIAHGLESFMQMHGVSINHKIYAEQLKAVVVDGYAHIHTSVELPIFQHYGSVVAYVENSFRFDPETLCEEHGD